MSTILLVEDNEMVQEMLAERLEYRGFSVLLASDGATAINIAHQNKPDLILMDMNLPKIDGWTATRRIREEMPDHHIPIIALTAHAIAGDREKCLAAGCDEYEPKPVHFKRLLQKINDFLT
ncbi:MAG TPA: response regulator [Anaerolineae bacterium]|nr:response regulator [Anaerolineae bacterium]